MYRKVIFMKNLYEKGLSFRSYIFNLDEESKHNIMKYYIPININNETKEKIKSIDKKIKILGVVDPTCPDCHVNLPLLEKIISTNNNIELRLAIRKMVNNEMKDYEEEGVVKVPTFVFMDEDYNIIGTFIEKPEIVKKSDTDTLEGSQINMKYRAGKLVDETVKEFLTILA